MRAYVLHPDLRNDRTRRLPEHGLAEAVSLAAALPNLDVIGAEVVRLPRLHPGMAVVGQREGLTARHIAAAIAAGRA